MASTRRFRCVAARADKKRSKWLECELETVSSPNSSWVKITLFQVQEDQQPKQLVEKLAPQPPAWSAGEDWRLEGFVVQVEEEISGSKQESASAVQKTQSTPSPQESSEASSQRRPSPAPPEPLERAPLRVPRTKEEIVAMFS